MSRDNLLNKYEKFTTIDKIDLFEFASIFFEARYHKIYKKVTTKAKETNAYPFLLKFALRYPNLLTMGDTFIIKAQFIDFLYSIYGCRSTPQWWYISIKKVATNKENLFKAYDAKMIKEFCYTKDITLKSVVDFYSEHYETSKVELDAYKQKYDMLNSIKGTKVSKTDKKDKKTTKKKKGG